jgi:hypothetical protein
MQNFDVPVPIVAELERGTHLLHKKADVTLVGVRKRR